MLRPFCTDFRAKQGMVDWAIPKETLRPFEYAVCAGSCVAGADYALALLHCPWRFS